MIACNKRINLTFKGFCKGKYYKDKDYNNIMPIATSVTQVQLYAFTLIEKLTKEFPNRFNLKKLTERTSMGDEPEHFIITKKIFF